MLLYIYFTYSFNVRYLNVFVVFFFKFGCLLKLPYGNKNLLQLLSVLLATMLKTWICSVESELTHSARALIVTRFEDKTADKADVMTVTSAGESTADVTVTVQRRSLLRSLGAVNIFSQHKNYLK